MMIDFIKETWDSPTLIFIVVVMGTWIVAEFVSARNKKDKLK